jgi:hypothetical protein
MAQPNQNNQNQGNKSQNTGAPAASTGSLQNKSQNDQMMAGLKDIDAKLDADSKPAAREGSDDKDTSSARTATKSPAQGKQASGGNNVKQMTKRSEGSEDSEESKGLSLDSFKNMSFELNKAVDFTKSYLAKDMTVPYLGKLGSELGEHAVEYVSEWAQKNNAKIDVQVTGIEPREAALYGGVGAAAGVGLGFALGGKLGGFVGLIFGAAVGTAASCVDVKFTTDESGASAQTVH